ncbi:MAG TPA: IclR family transcriptional regulator C-terminal domain-containing protein [Telluria sp.]
MKQLPSRPLQVARRDIVDGLVTGIEVITAFNDENARLTPTLLAARIGISRSAARRYLLTLVHTGMVATDAREFWLTPKVLTLGRAYLDSARLPRALLPYLQRLTAQVQESTNYSVLDGHEVVYLSRVNAPRHLNPGFDPGTRLPAYASTAGRVLLAALPDDQLQHYLDRVELLPFTNMTVIDREVLRCELMAIREHGFGVTENQFEMGMRGISVPLKSRRGVLIGALSVSTMVSSGSRAEVTGRCLPALQATANTLMLWL